MYERVPDGKKPRATEDWVGLTRETTDRPSLRRAERMMLRNILFAHQYLSSRQGIASRFEKRILAIERFRWRYKFFYCPAEIRIEELKRRFNKWRRTT